MCCCRSYPMHACPLSALHRRALSRLTFHKALVVTLGASVAGRAGAPYPFVPALDACMLTCHHTPRSLSCCYQRCCSQATKWTRTQHYPKAQQNDTGRSSTPLELLQQLGEDQGFRVELADADDEEDSETWEEAMDEMEDPWMREPAGESFAELGENTLAPASETGRKAVPVITADEFQAMSSQDDSNLLVVLDVRSEDEYQLGHLPAAQNVPLPGLTAGAAKQWHLKTVVVVGSGDFRSQQACTRLSHVFKVQSVFHLVPQPQV